MLREEYVGWILKEKGGRTSPQLRQKNKRDWCDASTPLFLFNKKFKKKIRV